MEIEGCGIEEKRKGEIEGKRERGSKERERERKREGDKRK